MTIDTEFPRRYLRVWTQTEIEDLRRYVADGMSEKEIADKMERTVSTILFRISSLGLKQTQKEIWTDEKLATLKRLIDEDKTYSKISFMMQIEYGVVRRKAIEMGYSRVNFQSNKSVKNLPFDDRMKKEIVKLWLENKSVKEISVLVRHNDMIVREYLRTQGADIKSRRSWCKEERDELEKAWNDNLPILEISHKFNRTIGAIKSQIHLMGFRNDRVRVMTPPAAAQERDASERETREPR